MFSDVRMKDTEDIFWQTDNARVHTVLAVRTDTHCEIRAIHTEDPVGMYARSAGRLNLCMVEIRGTDPFRHRELRR